MEIFNRKICKKTGAYCTRISRGKYHFMARYNTYHCGINAINNLYGKSVVKLRHFNMACEKFNGNGNKNTQGVLNVGYATTGLVNYLIQVHGLHSPVLIKNFHSIENIATLKSGAYLLYSWNKKLCSHGHFIALCSDFLICDRYLKSRKPWKRELSIPNVKLAFYGKQTGPIFAYKIFDNN